MRCITDAGGSPCNPDSSIAKLKQLQQLLVALHTARPTLCAAYPGAELCIEEYSCVQNIAPVWRVQIVLV
jgi:hypothetical protein